MLFLTATLLGLVAASHRSVAALMATAVMLTACFVAAALHSGGAARIADFGVAVLGMNFGVMLFLSALVVLAAIARRPRLSSE